MTIGFVVAHNNIVELKRAGIQADRAAIIVVGISKGFGQRHIVDGQFPENQQKDARVAIAVVVAVAADGPVVAVDGDDRGDRGQSRGQPERAGGRGHVDDVGAGCRGLGIWISVVSLRTAAGARGRPVGFVDGLRQGAASADVDVGGGDPRRG